MKYKKGDESRRVLFAVYKEFLLVFSAILIGLALKDIVANPLVLSILGIIFLVIYVGLKAGLKEKYKSYF